MTRYAVSVQDVLGNAKVLTSDLFGVNFVSRYDWEFTASSDLNTDQKLVGLLGDIGASNYRYPGGSITEDVFSQECFFQMDYEASSVTTVGGDVIQMTPMTEFFQTAGVTGASVTLVLPTRVAFVEGAAEALLDGTYGTRSEVSQEYLARLLDYVQYAEALAQEYGVTISALEVGNEFWGSGQMTAHEYARAASAILGFLEVQEQAGTISDYDKLVQVTSSVGAFSPSASNTILVKQLADGSYDLRELETVPDYDPASGEWIETHIEADLGNALAQTSAIGDILRESGVASLVDGAVHHNYFGAGFDGVNGSKDFGLSAIFDTFEATLGRSELQHAITEWSARDANAEGLQFAQMTVEGLYELAKNGVTQANFWPLTFGNPENDKRVLIDTSDGDLSFGGVAFQWLQETTVGSSPLFDFNASDALSVHAFGNDAQLTLFVGDRTGTDQHHSAANEVVLDLGALGLGGSYYVQATHLGETGETGQDRAADPVVTHFGGQVVDGSSVEVFVDAWGLEMIEMTAVTAGADTIRGREGDDTILGDDGNDVLYGAIGNDSLKGQFGNDRLDGGDGADVLKGGWGLDVLLGGLGGDKLYGNGDADVLKGHGGKDQLYGGDGDDALYGGGGNDRLFGEAGADVISGGGRHDYIEAGAGDDIVSGDKGRDTVDLGEGDDLFTDHRQNGRKGSDVVIGGEGDDTLESAGGHDTFSGGLGADTFLFRKAFQDVRVLDFDAGPGGDVLDVSDLVSADQVAGFILEHVTQVGDTTVISFDGGQHIDLEGVLANSLLVDHFIF